MRKYYFDTKCFDNIDTEWKSYFLGLHASDGTINRGNVRIKLKDRQILEDLREYFDPKMPLRLEVNGEFTCYSLIITSKEIANRLTVMGLGPRKTWSLSRIPPEIPTNLIRHFIRGYFDGDGSISKRTARRHQVTVSIASIRKIFLEDVNRFLRTEDIVANLYLEKRNGKALSIPSGKVSTNFEDMWRLVFTTHEARKAFYHLCWDNSTLCLERKKTLFTEYVESRKAYDLHRSEKYPWEDIYFRYLKGEEIKPLATEYGFYWRSFYLWMDRNSKLCRHTIARHIGNYVEKTADKLLENPKAQLATT